MYGKMFDARRSRNGEAGTSLSGCEDEADLKSALEALRQSEERYRRLFAGLRESVLVFQVIRDDAGTIVDWIIQDANPEAKETCPMGDVLGRRASEVFGDFMRPYIKMSNEVMQSAQPRRFEIYFPWNDRHYLVSAFPLDSDTLIISKVDITERKRAEEMISRGRDELEQIVQKRTAELVSSYEELKQRSEQLGRLASELTLAEQRERRRLATVLHDHLQQLLVGAKLRVEMLTRSADPKVRETANEVIALLSESINESRSLTAELSPPVLYKSGLGAALNWLAQWMLDKHGMTVQVEPDHVDDLTGEDARVMLFQAVRELLFNVVKHAGVKEALVEVHQTSRRMVITVRDEGAGFDMSRAPLPQARANSAGNFGLFSIRERIESIGGIMEVSSAPGRGTKVCLSVPLVREDAMARA